MKDTNAAVFLGLALFLAAGAEAAPGDRGSGIPKVAFKPEEVGKMIHVFPPINEATEGRAEEGTLFNGYLLYSGLASEFTWLWDLKDPRKPALVHKFRHAQNIHNFPSLGNRIFITGKVVDLDDPVNPVLVGQTGDAAAWQHLQYPYMYHTYVYGPVRPLSIVDYSDFKNIRSAKQVDMVSQLGFSPGTVHVIGNLLIVTSGEKYSGVSTWDIQDPLNPKLLASRQDGNGMYFSQIYGSWVVTAGPVDFGKISVFDFSDPYDLKKVWEGAPPNQKDYVRFQNGFMYGASYDPGPETPGKGRWVKTDVKTWKTAQQGDCYAQHYIAPLGNLIWVGTEFDRPSLAVHQAEPDNLGPSVLYANPMPGATRQALTSRIGLVFDEQVDNRTVDARTLQVRAVTGPEAGKVLDGWYSIQHGIVNFTPKARLLANTTYEVFLPADGVRDFSWNPISKPYIMRFSTGATVDPLGVGVFRPIDRHDPALPRPLLEFVGNGHLQLRWAGGSSDVTGRLIGGKRHRPGNDAGFWLVPGVRKR